MLLIMPLALFTAIVLSGGPPQLLAQSESQSLLAADAESADFNYCGSGPRINCVVDGDTFWYHGEKIRIADINTPEVSHPQCALEARLADRATRRLYALLNAGSFTLERIDRDRDQYGRLLRIVTRAGQSIGGKLVDEGLAEYWKGYRGSWC